MQPPELTKIPDSGLPWLWNLGIETANSDFAEKKTNWLTKVFDLFDHLVWFDCDPLAQTQLYSEGEVW